MMKKKPSYTVLLSKSKPKAVRTDRLDKDVDEVLEAVAKDDKLTALSRQRSVGTVQEPPIADGLLEMLRKGLTTPS